MTVTDLGLLSPDGRWQHWQSLREPVLLGRHRNGVTDPAYSEVQFSATTGPAENTVQLRNLGTNPLEVTLGQDAAINIIDVGEDLLVVTEAAIRVEGGSSVFRICPQPEHEPDRPAKRRRTCGDAEVGSSGARVEPAAAELDDVGLRRATGQQCSTSQTASPAAWLPPFYLMRNQRMAPQYNRGIFGIHLRELVGGGRMKWLLICNYMIDINWLLSALPAILDADAVVIAHGERSDRGRQELNQAAQNRPTWVIHEPPLNDSWGVHHSKLFLIEFERGVRLIVHTANLIHQDCNLKTQGLWYQDFPRKDAVAPAAAKGAPSEFEGALAQYLAALRLPPDQAARAHALCGAHDFSSARAHLVPSAPGWHAGPRRDQFGHMRVRSLLAREAFDPDFRGAPLLAQFSSMGSVTSAWLDEIKASLAAGRIEGGAPGAPAGHLGAPESFHVVWPAVEEVRASVEGWFAGCSIPGSDQNVMKADKGASRPLLQQHWCRFDGSAAGRRDRMPHIKSYTRFRGHRMAYMVLGSHNLSKAAWGALQAGGSKLHIRHYELGVLLLPSLEQHYRQHRHYGFSCTAEPSARHFTADAPVSFWAAGAATPAGLAAAAGNCAVLPVPYPLPPKPYAPGDMPWRTGVQFPGRDSQGLTLAESYAASSHYGHLEEPNSTSSH